MDIQEAIQVVKYDDGGQQLELSLEDLKRILLHENIKDREVVCVSIAGAFRKGKSFLLNFFLRYLNERYVKKSSDHEWIGEGESRLEGFRWLSGSSAVTTGIHMWSNIFLHDFDDGRKVAIILLDTQGTFDTKTTIKNCITIFALSTLLSSVQIFNLMQNIQEDDLQHLQYFTEYSRLVAKVSEKTPEKPFQKLMFLVRDWQYPDEHEYGIAGGQMFLNKILATFGGQKNEHKSLRTHIKSSFSSLQCFLMPHPGKNVTTSRSFDGKIGDVDPEFIGSLLELVPLLLAPENLIVKKINGQPVKASLFLKYFEEYFKMWKNGDLPEPMVLFEANAKIHNSQFVAECKQLYASHMSQFCKGSDPNGHDVSKLKRKHVEVTQLVEDKLRSCRLMDYHSLLGTCLEKLRSFINKEFATLTRENAAKINAHRNRNIMAACSSIAAIVGVTGFALLRILRG